MNSSHQQGALSRRTLLTLMTAGASGTLVACSTDGDKSTKKPLSPLNQLYADAKRLEPTAYVKTYDVGHGKSYATVTAALTAVMADRKKMLGVGSLAEAQSVPWVWSRVRVYPGEYHEFLSVPPHTAVIGMGEKPDEVRIHWDGSENTLQTTGRSLYVRNLRLDHTATDPMAHPMRESGASGDVGLGDMQRRTVTFESVHFVSVKGAPVGKCTNDMTPSGVVLTFRDCVFDGPGQPQSVNLVTGGKGAAMQTTFIGCRIVSNFEQHPDPMGGPGGGVGPGAPFGGPDAGLGRQDRVAWVDGSWSVGRTHGLQGLLVLPLVRTYPGKADLVASTDYYVVNPGSVEGVATVTPKGNASRVHTSLPGGYHLPVGGVSAAERAFYGEPPRTLRKLTPQGESAGTMDVAVGDVFWVRVPLEKYAACVSAIEVGGLTGGGATVAAALDHAGRPHADGNAQTVSGLGTTARMAVPTRWFFPGQGSVWLGVSFRKAARIPALKASAGAAWKANASASGVETAALRQVSAGDRIPVLTAESVIPDGFPA